MRRSEAYRFRVNIETAVQSLPDKSALEMRTFYPKFKELCDSHYIAEEIGFKFRYDDKLYKTKHMKHEFVSHYPPGVGTESLFEKVCETHIGTLDDPIPYDGNMKLIQGNYYSQDGDIYYCKYGSGISVYAHLSELTTFVEKV